MHPRVQTSQGFADPLHFGLMENLHSYMAGGKEWVLDSGCTDHMTGDKDMFHELAENDGPRKYVTFGDNSKGKVVGLGKVAISHEQFHTKCYAR